MSRLLWIAVLSMFTLNLAACSDDDSIDQPPPGLSRGPRLPDVHGPSDDDLFEDSLDPDSCPAVHLPPYPKYTPIKSVYEKPSELLTIQDTATALEKLRGIASPTPQYHADLLEIVKGAEHIDKEHLLLLIRAAYFTAESVERIATDLKTPITGEDSGICLRKAHARRDLTILKGYASFTQMILTLGLQKVEGLTWPDAMALIRETMPVDDGSKAFFYVAEKFKPLPEVDLRTLMFTANQKRAVEAAGIFAHDWFSRFTDRSFSSLLGANALLDGRAKDVFLMNALENFSTFSLQEARKLAASGHGLKGEIAGHAFKKVDAFSHAAVIEALGELDDQQRAEFLAIVIYQYPEISTSELSQLLNSTRYRRSGIALAAAPKVNDISVSHILTTLPFLSGDDRDKWILLGSGRLSSLSTDETISLIDQSNSSDGDLALSSLSKINDLTTPNALRIAQRLEEIEKKDAFLLQVVDHVTDLDLPNLEELAKASDAISQELLEKGRSRLERIETQASEHQGAPQASSSSSSSVIVPRLYFSTR